MTEPYNDMRVFYGDLHNHCNVGYGHGSLETAFDNAALQLDFLCMTPHAFWHDLPIGEPRLDAVADYHRKGFERTAAQWVDVQQIVRERYKKGQFVTFLGYEWHSLRYGDHNVYFNADQGELITADDMPELRAALRQARAGGIDTMLIPHHIGYRAGYRGINWAEFDPEFIRLVEIYSMHGASESPTSNYRYLHTMGPLDWQSSLQYGLSQGHQVGVIGSTDHHSAHPGSYGHGRAGVWARALTREAIWEALLARRTYALTGDRIQLMFSLNDHAMGSAVETGPEHQIDVQAIGGDALELIEVIHNNQVVYRWTPPLKTAIEWPEVFKVYVEVGWGKRGEDVRWDVDLSVIDGELLSVEPRFRGHEIVAPQVEEEKRYALSTWKQNGSDNVHFTTHTWGNLTPSTANTQGMCLELRADQHTRLVGSANGQPFDKRLSDLAAGPIAQYLGGFLTPVIYFNRAVPQHEYTAELHWNRPISNHEPGWTTIRLRQHNGHWAWSSPIWTNNLA